MITTMMEFCVFHPGKHLFFKYFCNLLFTFFAGYVNVFVLFIYLHVMVVAKTLTGSWVWILLLDFFFFFF